MIVIDSSTSTMAAKLWSDVESQPVPYRKSIPSESSSSKIGSIEIGDVKISISDWLASFNQVLGRPAVTGEQRAYATELRTLLLSKELEPAKIKYTEDSEICFYFTKDEALCWLNIEQGGDMYAGRMSRRVDPRSWVVYSNRELIDRTLEVFCAFLQSHA